MKNLFNRLTDTRQKKIIFSIVSSFLVFLLCFGLSKTNFVRNLLKMAGIYTQEEKVIEFYSDGWEENEPGSIKVTKSADWIAEDIAEITFDIESKVKTDTENVDVILAVDTSSDRNNDKVNVFRESTLEMASALLNNSNNRLSLIYFNDSATIMSELTNDIATIEEQLNNLEANGESNYYLALKDVENMLSSYTKEEHRKVIVIMLVDGRSSSSKAYAQYDVLKEKYPDITITGISYGQNGYIVDDLIKTSDIQYGATKDNLNVVLSETSLKPKYYESLELSDYIDEDFYVENKDAIEVPFGNVTLSIENDIQRVTWTIPKNTYGSGSKTSMSIKVKLDSRYANTENYYATNKKESIVYNFKDEETITINSTNTPVLKNGYKVVYDANLPSGCNISAINSEIHNVFNDVTISDHVPICDGYVFAGWEIITDNIDVVNDNEFIMPSNNVEIKGTWKKLSVSKSMNGVVYKKLALFESIQTQSLGTDSDNNIRFNKIASNTNGKGVYTLSGTENDEYPIYFYRGVITNNNVLFANFCWKIVRTTETGGVKLIYNGVPTNGTCNNTGTASQLESTSKFNEKTNSPAYVGYMYGNVYNYTRKYITWYNIYLGQSSQSRSAMASTKYMYGKSVTYSSSKGYTINDATNYLWDDNYSNLTGYYTCFSEDSRTCASNVFYIIKTTSSRATCVSLSNGNTYEEVVESLNSNPYIYGNDVKFQNGVYTLQATSSMSVMDWSKNYNNLSSAHYTCFSTSSSCSTVYFIYYADNSTAYYISLTDGKTIEDAVEEMTSESTNTTSSTIKIAIDTWYENNMTDYTQYLEDTVWCNDRTIYNIGGWSKDGVIGASISYGTFGRTKREYQPTLECKNEVDRFSLNNKKAKLTYPVGLLTADEVMLAGGATDDNQIFYLKSGQNYRLISPYTFYRDSSDMSVVGDYGCLGNSDVSDYRVVGVRPSVSLAPGAKYTDGDGSVEDPYVVDTTS